MTTRRNFISNSLLGAAGLSLGGFELNNKTKIFSYKNKMAENISNSDTYTLLTTCPPYGSQNVGDKLIEQRTKDLIREVKGDVEFLTIFREESLEPFIDKINTTRAILLPAFPIRDTPMFPGVYRLLDDISRIKVPMIPIGANWNTYPGDEISRRSIKYSKETEDFLTYIDCQVNVISCREYYTCDILRNHGFKNTVMTGDPAWYLIDTLDKPMQRPTKIDKLVFSPPLSAYYLDQAKSVMIMLSNLFPDSEITCAFHLFDADSYEDDKAKSENSAALRPEVTAKNRAIREFALSLGFKIKEMAGDLDNLEFYKSCDLHVGYECHAHLNFFSRRIPSVLIAEDARGVGFNYTLGIGGFDGFKRSQLIDQSERKSVTSGYATSISELALAPPKNNLHIEIEEFLIHEMNSNFRRYIGVAHYLDETYYKCMKPFLKTIP